MRNEQKVISILLFMILFCTFLVLDINEKYIGSKVIIDKDKLEMLEECQSGVKVPPTSNFNTLQSSMGKREDKASWIGGVTEDIEAPSKTLKVSGSFTDPNTKKIARKLDLCIRNNKNEVTKTFTLRVNKMYISSPGFYLSMGTLQGDMYVAKNVDVSTDGVASGFKAENGADKDGEAINATIDGNLYFSTQKQLDAYNSLPTSAKYIVTGDIGLNKINF